MKIYERKLVSTKWSTRYRGSANKVALAAGDTQCGRRIEKLSQRMGTKSRASIEHSKRLIQDSTARCEKRKALNLKSILDSWLAYLGTIKKTPTRSGKSPLNPPAYQEIEPLLRGKAGLHVAYRTVWLL